MTGGGSAQDHVVALVRDALEAVDDPNVPVSAVARRALRVARLRNDWTAVWWLQLEMHTVRTDVEDDTGKRIAAEVRAHLTAGEFEEVGQETSRLWLSGRHGAKNRFEAQSIVELETFAQSIQGQIDGLVMPNGLHPVDAYKRSEELLKLGAELRARLASIRGLIAHLRNQLGIYLGEVERELLFGELNADVWERNRRYVDIRLSDIAPEALAQFAAAYQRVGAGGDEARVHAATSCRRVLKTVADVLCPATGEEVEGVDGRKRVLSDDKFVVRLCHYATQARIGSASRELVVTEVETLGRKLDALVSLSSKGVHASIDEAEVDRCLVQTYLLVGDLLRLHDGTSAALLPHAASS